MRHYDEQEEPSCCVRCTPPFRFVHDHFRWQVSWLADHRQIASLPKADAPVAGFIEPIVISLTAHSCGGSRSISLRSLFIPFRGTIIEQGHNRNSHIVKHVCYNILITEVINLNNGGPSRLGQRPRTGPSIPWKRNQNMPNLMLPHSGQKVSQDEALSFWSFGSGNTRSH